MAREQCIGVGSDLALTLLGACARRLTDRTSPLSDVTIYAIRVFAWVDIGYFSRGGQTVSLSVLTESDIWTYTPPA